MKNSKKIIVFTLFFLILLFSFYFFIWQGIYTPVSLGSKREVAFEIKKGEGGNEISFNLKKENLIRSGISFRLYILFKGYSRRLQAGQYLLSSSMPVPEIVQKFVSGETIKEKITIIEGWNGKEIAAYFEEKGISNAEEFLNFINSPQPFFQEFEFLKDKPKSSGLEGYLFPDTYEVKKGESLEEIIKKMLKNFDRKLTSDLREKISQQGKTIFEVVTMASMIEKELLNTEECKNCKELVSGILEKRLEQGIPLQVDATISYITGKKTTQISIEDTKIDSPYNTYKYRDLPIGPISNPGLESILAAIYPQESEYRYYLSTPDGKTIFSKTLKEHNIAKAKYLR